MIMAQIRTYDAYWYIIMFYIYCREKVPSLLERPVTQPPVDTVQAAVSTGAQQSCTCAVQSICNICTHVCLCSHETE